MAATAAFNGIVRAGTSATPTDNIDARSVSPNISKALHDISVFGDSHIDRIAGQLDSGVSVSGPADYANTAQNAIRTAALATTTAGSTIYVRVLGDGTNGFEFQCLVGSYNESVNVDGVLEFTAEFSGIAAPTTVP